MKRQMDFVNSLKKQALSDWEESVINTAFLNDLLHQAYEAGMKAEKEESPKERE